MGVFQDPKGDIKIVRVVILVVAIILMILGYFWLNNPIKGDSCNPPRTQLDSIFSVSGQILWILFVIGLLFWSFTRGKTQIAKATRFGTRMTSPRFSTADGTTSRSRQGSRFKSPLSSAPPTQ